MFLNSWKRPVLSNTKSRSLLLPTGPWTHETVYASTVNFHVVRLKQSRVNSTLPPVIFLHDFPATWLQWQSVLPLLTDFRPRVYAVDVRGFGSSDLSAAKPTWQQLCFELRGLLASLGADKAFFVGCGMGAAYAQLFASVDADAVADLLLFNDPDNLSWPLSFPVARRFPEGVSTEAYRYAFGRVFAVSRGRRTAQQIQRGCRVQRIALENFPPLPTALELRELLLSRLNAD